MEKLPLESMNLLGVELTPQQQIDLEKYAHLLVEWNTRLSLTAIRDPDEIRIKHFLDSLSCLTVMSDPIGRLIDIGTGAGFPGLVMKIVRPEIHLTLVESVTKKANFCRTVVSEIGLRDVEILAERAEALGQQTAHRQQYDWAVARAVAAMPVLAEYLLPLLRVGGRMLAQKGSAGLEETRQAAAAIETLGGAFESSREIRLPNVPDPHLLLVIKKVRPTPVDYPRRVGIPGKHPL